jgi:YtkA-like protein
MASRFTIAGVALALAYGAASPASAAADEYVFEAVQAEMKKGDDVIVALRLKHKASDRPVSDAVIVRTRVDMAPDNMADMTSPVAAVPSHEPGVYAFKTDLPMAGRYLFSIAAKVQGERETVVGKVILKAVK